MIEMTGWLRLACIAAAVLLIPAVCVLYRLGERVQARRARRVHRWRL